MNKKQLIDSSKSIIDNAQREGRSLTDVERQKIKGNIAQVKALENETDEFRQFASLTAKSGNAGGDTFRPSVKSIANAIAPKVKGMVDVIDATLPVDVTTPVQDGMPASSVWDVVPMIRTPREYSFMRQDIRDNKADVVAQGDLKPTSKYHLHRVESRLKVVAHMSEPVYKYDLVDVPVLQQFLQSEMAYGLYLGMERQMFQGDGEGENFLGLEHVSGIQSQAFDTSPILTARKTITKVEAAFGEVGGCFVFNALDWEGIETATTSNGEYVLGDQIPVDRAARRLWGKPVSSSLFVPKGKAWYIAQDSLALASDLSLDFQWGVVGDSFAKNEVLARMETRADLMVKRPMGIVQIALS